MASFGPLQSSGGVASSNFDFTHLSIHANQDSDAGVVCSEGVGLVKGVVSFEQIGLQMFVFQDGDAASVGFS